MSGLKPFRKIKATDRELANVQDQVASVLGPISRVTILNGVQIDGVLLTTAGVTLDHLLTRQPLGWFIVDADAAATVYRSAWNDRNITLVSSAPVTTSIWIY